MTDSLVTGELVCFVLSVCLQVLIIGGGDGGVLREVVKHPLVTSVVQCEIDEVCVYVCLQRCIISTVTQEHTPGRQ